MDFDDLKDDAEIQEKLTNFHGSIKKIEKVLERALKIETEELPLKEKIDHDLFLSFTFSTLFWLYLRSKGENPNNNEVKNQLSRIKDYMLRAKQAHERHTIRPKLDQKVAERFVKHGISHRDEKGEPLNKKTRFE